MEIRHGTLFRVCAVKFHDNQKDSLIPGTVYAWRELGFRP